VAIFTESLLAGEHPKVNRFPEEERGMIRDYCYVKDIANASLIAAKNENVGIYNIGTGKGTYTLELYKKTIDALRKNGVIVPEIFNEPLRGIARAGDIRISTLNAGKAKNEIDWEAKYSLEDGLIETVEWYLHK